MDLLVPLPKCQPVNIYYGIWLFSSVNIIPKNGLLIFSLTSLTLKQMFLLRFRNNLFIWIKSVSYMQNMKKQQTVSTQTQNLKLDSWRPGSNSETTIVLCDMINTRISFIIGIHQMNTKQIPCGTATASQSAKQPARIHGLHHNNVNLMERKREEERNSMWCDVRTHTWIELEHDWVWRIVHWFSVDYWLSQF